MATATDDDRATAAFLRLLLKLGWVEELDCVRTRLIRHWAVPPLTAARSVVERFADTATLAKCGIKNKDNINPLPDEDRG